MSAASATVPPCRWCGQIHGVRCPALRAIEYFENGAVKRVEFAEPKDTARYSDSFLRDFFGVKRGGEEW